MVAAYANLTVCGFAGSVSELFQQLSGGSQIAGIKAFAKAVVYRRQKSQPFIDAAPLLPELRELTGHPQFPRPRIPADT